MLQFSPDTTDPDALRMVDAMLHHLLIGTPLMLRRGPMYDGVPVPRYTCDAGAAYDLVKSCHADARISVSTLTGDTICEIHEADKVCRRACPGEHPALLLSLLCLEHSLSQTSDAKPDDVWHLIETYVEQALEGDWMVGAANPRENLEALS